MLEELVVSKYWMLESKEAIQTFRTSKIPIILVEFELSDKTIIKSCQPIWNVGRFWNKF